MSTITASAASRNTDTHQAVTQALASAKTQLGGQLPSFGFLFVGPDHDLQKATAACQQQLGGAPVLSCTTAGEITEHGLTHGGVALMLVSSDSAMVQAALARGLKSNTTDAATKLASGFDMLKERGRASGMSVAMSLILVDCLGGTGELLVDQLRAKLGGLHDIVGGAAGDEGRFKGTPVGALGESGTDAAAVMHVVSKKQWGVGVDHGLSAATELSKSTRVDGNVIYEIDGKPAFTYYQEFAKGRGVALTRENAGAFLINHELGIYIFDKFKKARAPLSVGADGSLACAAEIPKGAKVAILDGKRDELARAAKSAALEAKERLQGARAAGVLLFDCICRGTILGDEFQREVEAVRSVFPNAPLAGFLTYGEIARYSGRLDGWHNTTAVVVAIPE